MPPFSMALSISARLPHILRCGLQIYRRFHRLKSNFLCRTEVILYFADKLHPGPGCRDAPEAVRNRIFEMNTRKTSMLKYRLIHVLLIAALGGLFAIIAAAQSDVPGEAFRES